MARFWDEDDYYEYNMLPETDFDGHHYADDINQRATIKEEIDSMFKHKLIKRNRKRQLIWIHEDLLLYKYAQFIGLCEDGLLYWHDNILWVYDPDHEVPHIDWDTENYF